MSQPETQNMDLVDLTTDIVSAYFANNAIAREDVPEVIRSFHAALLALASPEKAPVAKQEPAVPVRKSVTPEYIYSLEDGKPYKTLKRHLGILGMTPAQYREKWSLSPD